MISVLGKYFSSDPIYLIEGKMLTFPKQSTIRDSVQKVGISEISDQ
jgi:hypothetical protein